MEDLTVNDLITKQYEKAKENRDETYEKLLIAIDPLIDEMNILLGQILDMADKEDYNFEEEVSEKIVLELGL